MQYVSAAVIGSFFHNAGTIAAVIMAALVGAVITGAVYWRTRKKKSGSLPDWGFAFDPSQDIFYSTMDAWQKEFGYCRLYDEAAAPMSMVIDCEPVRFDYGGKSWLIEFWKGQYGMTTGAEVGVYCTDRPAIEIPGVFEGRLYRAAEPDDMLEIDLTLLKNGRVLFARCGRHWWLTGFVLGMFSRPEELALGVRVYLKDDAMYRAFLGGLGNLGYTDGDYRADPARHAVALTMTTPRSRQPETRGGLLESFVQNNNRLLCEAYGNIAGEFADSGEKLAHVKREYPQMYAMIMQRCHARGLYADFGRLSRAVREAIL